MFCSRKAAQVSSDNVDTNSLFDSTPVTKTVSPIIKEVSGIADSKAYPGFLWAEEDSGNPPQLSLIGHDGKVTQKVHIEGAVNRDWEEMAIVGDTLYIADIGDNSGVFASYKFYQLVEPAPGLDKVNVNNEIEFQYSDGSHDAEAFIVDSATKDIYIITKRDNQSGVYKLTFPFSVSEINTAYPVAKLPYSGVVSATISKNSKELIVKTYKGLYHYNVENKSIAEALEQSFTMLPYVLEPQGEAVTFSADNSGYFTISEKGLSADVKLYFYKRR